MDKPLNVLACAEQLQFCNPNRPKDSEKSCSPLLDYGSLAYNFENYTSEILDTKRQIQAIVVILSSALKAEMRVSNFSGERTHL